MGRTVAWIDREMDSREFAEHRALEMVNGPGVEKRLDILFARLYQLLISMNLKSGAKPPKIEDVLIDFDQTKERPKPEDEPPPNFDDVFDSLVRDEKKRDNVIIIARR